MNWNVTGENYMPKGDNPLGNAFYGYRQTNLDLPDGSKAVYHGVVVEPCVHVVAIEEDLTTYLVRQRRPNVRQVGSFVIPETLELPGGFQKQGLDELSAANHELRQEIGKSAHKLELLGRLYPSAGISNEVDSIYLATKLRYTPLEKDEPTERDMRVESGKFGVMYSRILRSELSVSAQTLAGMAMAADRL